MRLKANITVGSRFVQKIAMICISCDFRTLTQTLIVAFILHELVVDTRVYHGTVFRNMFN